MNAGDRPTPPLPNTNLLRALAERQRSRSRTPIPIAPPPLLLRNDPLRLHPLVSDIEVGTTSQSQVDNSNRGLAQAASAPGAPNPPLPSTLILGRTPGPGFPGFDHEAQRSPQSTIFPALGDSGRDQVPLPVYTLGSDLDQAVGVGAQTSTDQISTAVRSTDTGLGEPFVSASQIRPPPAPLSPIRTITSGHSPSSVRPSHSFAVSAMRTTIEGDAQRSPSHAGEDHPPDSHGRGQSMYSLMVSPR